MIRSHTKRALEAAVSELKRDGYGVLILMFDKKKDEKAIRLGESINVMCSETNDPQLLAAMAKDALTEISRPINLPETIN